MSYGHAASLKRPCMIVVGSFAFIFFVCGVHEATDFLMDSFGILALGESFKVFIVYL